MIKQGPDKEIFKFKKGFPIPRWFFFRSGGSKLDFRKIKSLKEPQLKLLMTTKNLQLIILRFNLRIVACVFFQLLAILKKYKRISQW